MSLPNNVPAGFVHDSSFTHAMDVNLGSEASPSWQEVRLITNLAITRPKVTRDEQVYENAGAPNQGIMGVGHNIVCTLDTPIDATTGARLPEFSKMRAASDSAGAANSLHVRWYHRPRTAGVAPDPDDAWEGHVSTDMSWANTGPGGEVKAATFTLAGQGPAVKIANPAVAIDTDVVPTISAIGPAGQAVEEQIEISGAGFTGATAVMIDTLAAAFTVVNDALIVATIPAGAIGAAPVDVTTPAGTSSAVEYTVAA
jgi:hypothetical protein